MRSAWGTRAVAAVLILILGSAASAATVNYGDFIVSGGVYEDVTETSVTDPLPLYGPPITGGSSLTFNTSQFASSATNGDADVTLGKLEFTLQADQGLHVEAISVEELGDLLLLGADSQVAISGTLTVRYFDSSTNSFVSLFDAFDVTPTMPVTGADTNSAVWQASASINLAQMGIQTDRVIVVLDNILATSAAPSGIAVIDKKAVTISAILAPEPGTLLLAACGTLMLARRRMARRREA